MASMATWNIVIFFLLPVVSFVRGEIWVSNSGKLLLMGHLATTRPHVFHAALVAAVFHGSMAFCKWLIDQRLNSEIPW